MFLTLRANHLPETQKRQYGNENEMRGRPDVMASITAAAEKEKEKICIVIFSPSENTKYQDTADFAAAPQYRLMIRRKCIS
jgi:hypothetical protein